MALLLQLNDRRQKYKSRFPWRIIEGLRKPAKRSKRCAEILLKNYPRLLQYYVLAQEVNYQSDFSDKYSFRAQKRFPIVDSPITQVNWHRIVYDEAQMVGIGVSNIAQMAKRIRGQNRWCVSGTPIGPNQLQDLKGLLSVLEHDPFDGPAFDIQVKRPIYAQEPIGWLRLYSIIKPIMWRTSKIMANEDLIGLLPARYIGVYKLSFSIGERTFYEHVLESAKTSRSAIQIAEVNQVEEAESGGQKKKRRSSYGKGRQKMYTQEELSARFEISQLRLACIHPQLTKVWRKIQGELQLDQGGALTMSEIMDRLINQTQLNIQASERELCQVLNELAIRSIMIMQQCQLQYQTYSNSGDVKDNGIQNIELTKATQEIQSNVDKYRQGGRMDIEALPKTSERIYAVLNRYDRSDLKKDYEEIQDPVIVQKFLKSIDIVEFASDAYELLLYAQEISDNGFEGLVMGSLMQFDTGITSLRLWKLVEIHTLDIVNKFYDMFGYPELGCEALEGLEKKSEEYLQTQQVQIQQTSEKLETTKQIQQDSYRLSELYSARISLDSLDLFNQLQLNFKQWWEQFTQEFQQAKQSEVQSRENRQIDVLHTTSILQGTAVSNLLNKHEEEALNCRTIAEAMYCKLSYIENKGRLKRFVNILKNKEITPQENQGSCSKNTDNQLQYSQQILWSLAGLRDVQTTEQNLLNLKLDLIQSRMLIQDLTKIDDDLQRRHVAAQKLIELKLKKRPILDALEIMPMDQAIAIQDYCTERLELVRSYKELYARELNLEVAQNSYENMQVNVKDARQGIIQQGAGCLNLTNHQLNQKVSQLKGLCFNLMVKKKFYNNQLEQIQSLQSKQEDQNKQGLEQGKPNDRSTQPQLCAVCQDSLENKILHIFPCGHFYCEKCSNTIIVQTNPKCPLCREKVTQKQIFRVAQQANPQVSSQNQELVPSSIASAFGDAGGFDVELGGMYEQSVVGAWMTKIESLVKYLLYLKQAKPDDKSLVFSQYPEALQLLVKALAVNGIKHVQFHGSRSSIRKGLNKFLEDDDTRVFILSLKTGAQGLTLVRANHVFLLEPSLDPAIEQQAVARVHRVGQKKPVYIHRIIILNSVEGSILEIQQQKQLLIDEEQLKKVGLDSAHQGSSQHMFDEQGTNEATQVATLEYQAPKLETFDFQDVRSLLDKL